MTANTSPTPPVVNAPTQGNALREAWLRLRPSPEALPPAFGGPRRLQLALQGGGAHGAFTWGVLDRLLRDSSIEFEAISGSSAGAMNATVMASGWRHGGRKGARRALDRFWGAVGEQVPESVARLMGLELPMGASVGRLMQQWISQMTPQVFNPMDHNPLRDILLDQVDFDDLRSHAPFRLYIAATQVRTGRLKLFREHELTADHVLASACLPMLHHTVMIDGEAYWDGAFSANPALFPLIEEGRSSDLLLVLLNPPEVNVAVDTREAIDRRLSSLAFSTHLMRELDMIEQLQRKARRAWWPSPLEKRLRQLRLHWIDVSEVDALRGHDTKLLACTPFLEELRELGDACATKWLRRHRRNVGSQASFDFRVLA
ncbi:patatin-like phospholipase family protein [Aquabacterium parvum]|uniref:patatin-like phospholipase family protein n=1 Tax=Aquabacterium parvum TaxID=70584 RepID=UPI0009FA7F95|nr:patatin-like phospholipase family protein [Aquabacterium parvum]MBU0914923.1 patatin-like phospholipase family protein [Gammaproteobacteria bacterium]